MIKVYHLCDVKFCFHQNLSFVYTKQGKTKVFSSSQFEQTSVLLEYTFALLARIQTKLPIMYTIYIMLVVQMPKSKLFVALTTAHNVILVIL